MMISKSKSCENDAEQFKRAVLIFPFMSQFQNRCKEHISSILGYGQIPDFDIILIRFFQV